jgi:hypothetical protein
MVGQTEATEVRTRRGCLGFGEQVVPDRDISIDLIDRVLRGDWVDRFCRSSLRLFRSLFGKSCFASVEFVELHTTEMSSPRADVGRWTFAPPFCSLVP